MLDSAIMSRRAPPYRALLVALALGALAAPAIAAEAPVLADRWKAAQGVPPSIRKVLIVGITPDVKARRRFEDRFVTVLRARSVEAITGQATLALTAHRFADGLALARRAHRIAPAVVAPYPALVDGLIETGRYA